MLVAVRCFWGVVLIVGLTACSQHNPASCCETQQQCFMLGLSQIYECGGEQVCDSSGTCVDPQCTYPGDCPMASPFCVNHLCTSACSSGDDCVSDAAHPLCAPDGSCVACLDSSVCAIPKAICDTATHECRGCMSGADCDSMICNLSAGTCDDANLYAFVSTAGSDAGACSAASPCHSINYAISQLGARSNVWILGSSYTIDAPITLGSVTVTIGSEHATVSGTGSQLVLVAGGSTHDATIRSTTFSNSSGADVSVLSRTLTLDDVTLMHDFSVSSGATLVVTHSQLRGGASAGTTTIKGSITKGEITVSAGTFNYDSNQFTSTTGRAITGTAGTVLISNSLFVTNGATGSVVALAGSTQSIQFSTFVDLQNPSVPAISCAGPAQSNIACSIDAWNAIGSTSCSYSFTLFNGTTPPIGSGNVASSEATFFVGAGDYHLAPGSPARGGGSVGYSNGDHDLDGNPRPLPSSTNPDMGAYEAN